ncbi:MAG: hypothetical protein B7Z26_08040 [Asticcacaulis sp. 32-58-5]|nr:MAG: hypothetical protein B7Z26_08040 [Asticcacaulis sp. 32-58-5]
MSERIEALLAHLKDRPADRSLDELERQLRRIITDNRTEARTVTALFPLRAASFALAVALGATAGGALAVSGTLSDRSEPLGNALRLAPSSLLEGHS